MSNLSLKAVHTSDWMNIRDVSKKYGIDIYDLADAIEEKTIKTRGMIYDDKEGYYESKPIEISSDKWQEFIFEFQTYDVPVSEDHPEGKKEFSFLFGYQDGFSLPSDSSLKPEIKSGYTDIQVYIPDFSEKIKFKKIQTGKRIHKHKKYIKDSYEAYKKLKKIKSKVSPDEFLEYFLENYYMDVDSINNFEIEKVVRNPHEKRKSKLFILVEGQELPKEMTFARFYNIVSELNNS